MVKRKLAVGDKARNFTLEDQNEEEFTLSDFKGKRTLLSFHPLAWTPVCAEQMKSLEKNKNTFDSLKTIAVGLSVDSVPSKKAWADHLSIKNTRLLSDFWPHGKVAKLYGIFRRGDGTSERANIIIDENQKIIFFRIYEISKLPDIQEILDTLNTSNLHTTKKS
ncbi:redoxin domain-containing protein [Candidatus Bathyarchaeota archaeon]|nr:redoxin domain-containing protein [Candidatus Bathyarchaeota archaeon]